MLSGSGNKAPNRFVEFDLTAIDVLLARNAKSCPWHGCEAFWRDVFIAVQTSAIGALNDPGKGVANLPQEVRIPVKISNGKVAFTH